MSTLSNESNSLIFDKFFQVLPLVKELITGFCNFISMLMCCSDVSLSFFSSGMSRSRCDSCNSMV